MKHERKVMVGLIIVITFFVTPVAFIGFNMWRIDRWPFRLGKLTQLSQESTMDDVRQLLGSPVAVYHRTNQTSEVWQEWIYARPMAWPVVHIYFNPDGMYSTNVCDY